MKPAELAGYARDLDAARAKVASAEQDAAKHDARAKEARTAIGTAAERYSDDASEANASAYRAAKDAAELADLAHAGSVRRLDAARAALDAADMEHAGATMLAAYAAADRAAVFDALDAQINEIARLDNFPAVDLYQGDDRTVLAALDAAHGRAKLRALAARRIRATVAAQNEAVATVAAAAARLEAWPSTVQASRKDRTFAAAWSMSRNGLRACVQESQVYALALARAYVASVTAAAPFDRNAAILSTVGLYLRDGMPEWWAAQEAQKRFGEEQERGGIGVPRPAPMSWFPAYIERAARSDG